MEDQVQRLVNKAWKRFQEAPQDQRFMIAISGIPGSGKTTLSQTVTTALNSIHQAQHPGSKPVAAFCPMDGYHLTRAQLSAMPDPTNAHARRGAEFTFDGPAFLALVKALRAPLPAATAENSDDEEDDDKSTIYAPSFDHAVKDPKDNDIPLRRHHRIVVFEGNYVCLDKEPWREAAGLMDERWFVEVDFDVARRRLIKRHVKAGIAADEVQAGKRADENDLLNGQEIVDNKVQIDEVVVSREDEAWKHE